MLQRRIACVLGALVLALGPSTLPAAPAGQPPSDDLAAGDGVLTLLDYLGAGRDRADRFVRQQQLATGQDLAASLARARRASVRIEVQYNRRGSDYQAFTASGVLVDSGRHVLTAGHALADLPEHRIRVTLSDGRSFEAREVRSRYEVFASGSEDWGLLELMAPAGESLPSVPVGKPEEGSLAFVLGYPADLGLTPEGLIAPSAGRDSAPLDPLLFVGRVRSAAPLDLDPVAGCVPLGGASGAPVVNERGELLGVFVSVSQATSGGRVRQSYQAARVDALDRGGSAPRPAALP